MRVVGLAAMTGLAALCLCTAAAAQQPIKYGDILVGIFPFVGFVIPTERKSKRIKW